MSPDGDQGFPGRLVAEVRFEVSGDGVGVLLEATSDAPVCLFVDLDREVERLPLEQEMVRIAGIDVPVVALSALEASAPVKVEAALRLFGLRPK